MTKTCTIALSLLCLVPSLLNAQDRPEFKVKRTEKPPVIDGILNDDAWNILPLPTSSWLSYDPLYGQPQEQRTEVRVTYDDRNIYFAFHCLDSDPGRIRTTIARRDNIFNDDWVGLSLDSGGNGQTSYHMMVNPSGIQMDALNTSASGEAWEADWIWDSAGKLTDDGYTVEIRLPLQSIRFKGGDEVTMGILFWRRISRLGVSASWPDIPPGQWVFNRHAHLVFDHLKQPPLIELLPTTTYSINQNRSDSGDWNPSSRKADAGLSIKYGLTSSVTLDATVNPDFSQVESDAFQVQVNQRFPIFFSEKRPFFMEGIGLFNLAGAGNGDGNMATAVHTRRIVNPSWGSKLTGSAGRMSFGLLTADDESPEDLGNRGEAVAGRKKLFTIARAIYGLGESNYIGAILTDTEHAGRRNRVFGSDLSVRYAKRQQISATFLSSKTTLPDQKSEGTAAQVTYSFSTKPFSLISQTEHYDKGFQMDTAFYNRTGFTSNWTYAGADRYPKNSNSWLKKYTLFYWNKASRDRLQGGSDNFHLIAFRMNFVRQGYFRVDHGVGHEPWAGQEFKDGSWRVQGGMQMMRWLNVNGNFRTGWSTYYDPADPFQGKSNSGNVGMTFQPNARFSQAISFNKVVFNRASTGELVYDVNIANLRSTYQFNKHFFLRAIEQYDSSQRRVLTDFLASYELVPGSVMHAGYGSLIQKQGDQPYMTVSRSLFFKASYLHRF
jgi:hypothetical protein